eukprot:298934-Prymnesium_polylepis.1
MLRALTLAARPAARPDLDAVRDQMRDADDTTARRRLLHARRQRGHQPEERPAHSLQRLMQPSIHMLTRSARAM